MPLKVFDPKKYAGITISSVIAKDIRFPTSLEQHGSDAMHTGFISFKIYGLNLFFLFNIKSIQIRTIHAHTLS